MAREDRSLSDDQVRALVRDPQDKLALLARMISLEPSLMDDLAEAALFLKVKSGDAGSIRFWLANRRPERWGSRVREEDDGLDMARVLERLKRVLPEGTSG